jgi:hypothetical protein
MAGLVPAILIQRLVPSPQNRVDPFDGLFAKGLLAMVPIAVVWGSNGSRQGW